MSFYGNINNYFSSKGIKKINIQIDEKTESYEADKYESEGTIDLTESVKLLSQVSINIDENPSDNNLVYIIKQFGVEQGRINVPLDLILYSAEIVWINDEGETDGPYIKLVFKTEETLEKTVYINVKELNEVVGGKSTTIDVQVSSDQKITAEIIDGTITEEKIDQKLKDKINTDTNTITEIVAGNNVSIVDTGVNGNHKYTINAEAANSFTYTYDSTTKTLIIS